MFNDFEENNDNNDDNNFVQEKSKLYTTETDMMVGFLADENKLIDTEQRWYYDKDNKTEQNNVDVDIEEIPEDVDVQFNNFSKNNNQNFQKIPDNLSSQQQKKQELPQNVTQNIQHQSQQPQQQPQQPPIKQEEVLTAEEKVLRNLDMLQKLGELKTYGVKLTQNYTVNSDYKTMKYEYELHTNIKAKQDTVSWLSNMLIGLTKGVEMLNSSYNPFDIDITGWSANTSANIEQYYSILGEIYEKYLKAGKSYDPIAKLIFALITSLVTLQMHRKVISLMPADSEKLAQNDAQIELLRRKAMENTKNNNIQTHFAKEHENVNERIKDLQEIKNKELEIQRIEKQLAEEDNKYKNLKSGLELSPESHHMSESMLQETKLQEMRMQEAKIQEMRMQEARLQDIKLHEMRMQEARLQALKEKTKILTPHSNKSESTESTNTTTSKSHMSVNKKLIKNISSKLSTASSEKKPKTQTKDISLDAISFSNSKKKIKNKN